MRPSIAASWIRRAPDRPSSSAPHPGARGLPPCPSPTHWILLQPGAVGQAAPWQRAIHSLPSRSLCRALPWLILYRLEVYLASLPDNILSLRTARKVPAIASSSAYPVSNHDSHDGRDGLSDGTTRLHDHHHGGARYRPQPSCHTGPDEPCRRRLCAGGCCVHPRE